MDKSRKNSASNVEADPAHDLKNNESEENEKFEATSGKAESKDYLKTIVNQKKQTKDVLKDARVTRFSDLPLDLVGDKILTKVPITSLGAVRSTCKSWEALSRDWILSKAAEAARRQFFGFMTINGKLYSLRFDLRKDKDKEVDHSMKRVDIFNQVTISKVFHCDGLLLCVPRDNSSLVVCNPYLGQTRWIEHRTKVHKLDRYALGYDKNGNHKILKLTDGYDPKSRNLCLVLEIYELSSRSWRVLGITSDWEIEYNPLGASLKGNTYFFAQEGVLTTSDDGEDCLVCFDFTNERFGPRLPLPFHSCSQKAGELSCVRDEQLAVLYQPLHTSEILEFWVTTRIEPNTVAWSKFLTVDMRPHTRYLSGVRTFFIDQEEKVAVVFKAHSSLPTETGCDHSAFIIGDDGYFKSVGLGKCRMYCYPSLVCSSFYLPSLVQVT